jgi:hypothetical protein
LKKGNSKTSSSIALVLMILVVSIVSAGLSAEPPGQTLLLNGSISYDSTAAIDITINTGSTEGVNNLSLAFMLDWERWASFKDSPIQQQMARDAGFKLVRVFDFRKTSSYGYPNLMPCTQWDEATKTGKWSWTQVDNLTQAILSTGAEPLFCLGNGRTNIKDYIPPGMAVNTTTGLPNPQSYAAYAKEWVKHFKTTGAPVRYYQILNEPYFYFGWTLTAKLGYCVDVWNAAARAMRSENPNILLSQDSMTIKFVFDYWLTHGDNVDYLDFHKYDADTIGTYSDAQMFTRAEQNMFETKGSYYGVEEARQKWLTARGKWLPVINSESNFNSGWDTGTDPKIQQMSGAVWLSLVLRTAILKGLSYSVYFEFSSSKSQAQAGGGTGWGFGMVNKDDNKPWYPYYVQKMIGSNLAIGNRLVKTQCSSEDVRSIAWINQGKLNILVICKVDQPRTVSFQGVNGQLSLTWIDSTVAYTSPVVQTGNIDSGDNLALKGYTVALLQCPVA